MIATTVTAKEIKRLSEANPPKGEISNYWLHLINNGLGEPIRIPIVIAKGVEDGPTLGLTAAVHGNELNGIPIIQKMFEKLNPEKLRGTVIGVLAVNIPGVLRGQREFMDGTDLNHIAPGKPDGNVSQVYINRIVERIVQEFDYLIDLHTASFGRVNSYYIRANMKDKVTSKMARIHAPDIILNHAPSGYTVRGVAASRGIHSITLELKDPGIFQQDVITEALNGVRNVLYNFKMLDGEVFCPSEYTILCERSYWMFTSEGGILSVLPNIKQFVKKDELIAEVRTVFGTVTKQFFAPEDGIVIGKSVNPINQTGSRILHLGVHPREISCIE